MKKNSKFIPNKSGQNSKSSVALLWDESFLWGLMAYKALGAAGLPFQLVRSENIRKGLLEKFKVLFVPGGWASNKMRSLGDDGIDEIKRFVRNGGNYLGFCGGAGLATLDGIGLLNVKRKPTVERVPSFSGRIYLDINKHPIWERISERQDIGVMEHWNIVKEDSPSLHRSTISSTIFHAWWPSQFLIEDSNIKILATYGDALSDSFSSDLNVGDTEADGRWSEMEKIYRINLDPERLKNEPAVVEGNLGKGKVILSLIHFDTPDDINGQRVLKNLWGYLGAQSTEHRTQNTDKNHNFFTVNSKVVRLSSGLYLLASDLISLGIRNFLWFWRNPMLLQWRRGVRGLEYCTLYVMIKEIAEMLEIQNIENEKMRRWEDKSISSSQLHDFPTSAFNTNLNRIRNLLMPFTERAKQLLILERHAMQKGYITSLSSSLFRGRQEDQNAPKIQEIKIELFGNSKSHGGLFKNIIDETDELLYTLLEGKKAFKLNY